MDKVNTIELVEWETVREDCKYPIEDNNNGYTFGIYYIDSENEGDILDVEWFKTNVKRELSIKENNLRILDEY